MISKYEPFLCPVKNLGGDIPQEIRDSNLYLDFDAPTLSKTTYNFTVGTISNIDWETYVSPTDNYTSQNDIIVDVTYDLVNYNRPGTYTVKVKLTDLIGNSRYNYISVIMIDGSRGGLIW